MNDSILNDLVKYLKSKYQVHTIIIYGSRARNEATDTSDYDILAIREQGEDVRDCKLINNFYLDAFIYSETALEHPNNYMIRIKDGKVLEQKNNIGDVLIAKVKKIFAEGPDKTPVWEKNEISTWLEKMFKRAKVNDIEGNFRLHWLLHDLLECYFKLRDLWYLGPKESFQWMKENDSQTYEAFDKSLKANASCNDIHNAIQKVIKYP